jgi:hypothetical protein
MSTKEVQESLVSAMQRWQKIEDASVTSTGRVIDKTKNPVLRLIMEIIQRDSQMHHRIQGMIADSLSVEGRSITLTPDELGEVWELVEKHIQLEKQTVALANEALKLLAGKKLVVQEYLLNYLLTDENKHNTVLEQLEIIKRGMYPYG